MQTRWQLLQPDPETVRNLAEQLACSPVTAALLVNRKIDAPESADRFMDPSLDHIRPPFAMKDMATAVDRIARAVTRNEHILIFGDYDVDGVTATAILYEFLDDIGAKVFCYIPHRTREGYSLQPNHIHDHAVPGAIDLIVTTDCGSGSHEAIDAARRAGIDVVVTDHHKISTELPAALAVVNPSRPDCTAGYAHLAGVGVAFCLLICLRKHLRDAGFWRNRQQTEPNLKSFCDLVALGTIADMVPLLEENRIFSRTGLKLIGMGNRCGISALLKHSRVAANSDKKAIDANDIAFRLAPRINAAGRMDHARLAFELLTTPDPAEADRIAATLDSLNSNRQEAEKAVIDDALRQIERDRHFAERFGIVLSGTQWHQGILGIAASRIAVQYHRPVVLISVKDGIGRGSARSIPGFDLYRGLSACAADLTAFGGHTMAAGLSIPADRIDHFRARFEEEVCNTTSPDDFTPSIVIDDILDFDQISERLTDEIENLSPFGAGNPEPLFTARDIAVVSSRIVGNRHRQLRLRQMKGNSPHVWPAIHFNIDPDQPCPDRFDQIAFRLRWNRWNGQQSPQLVIEDVK